MPEQIAPLSHDYVFNYVFKKLADTFDQYRDLIPDVEELESSLDLVMTKAQGDPFQITLAVIEVLKEHAGKSELVNEMFENVRRDLWHKLKPEQVAKHEGKFYIDSVAT